MTGFILKWILTAFIVSALLFGITIAVIAVIVGAVERRKGNNDDD